MELNAWGAPRKMVVSDRSFGDYLTRKETSELHKVYRDMNMKQFHYSNAATITAGPYTSFWSYYTRICTVGLPRWSDNVYLDVYPFIYDTDNFRNSPTTNKQFNKFLKEFINADVSVFDIRRIYERLLVFSTSTPALKTYDGRYIDISFSTMCHSLLPYQTHESKETRYVYCRLEHGYYIPEL